MVQGYNWSLSKLLDIHTVKIEGGKVKKRALD
jgi:hypothetical protein